MRSEYLKTMKAGMAACFLAFGFTTMPIVSAQTVAVEKVVVTDVLGSRTSGL